MRIQRADWIGGVGSNNRLLESNLVSGVNSYLIQVYTHTHIHTGNRPDSLKAICIVENHIDPASRKKIVHDVLIASHNNDVETR